VGSGGLKFAWEAFVKNHAPDDSEKRLFFVAMGQTWCLRVYVCVCVCVQQVYECTCLSDVYTHMHVRCIHTHAWPMYACTCMSDVYTYIDISDVYSYTYQYVQVRKDAGEERQGLDPHRRAPTQQVPRHRNSLSGVKGSGVGV
jgi:hypothetical protein